MPEIALWFGAHLIYFHGATGNELEFGLQHVGLHQGLPSTTDLQASLLCFLELPQQLEVLLQPKNSLPNQTLTVLSLLCFMNHVEVMCVLA